MDIPTKKDRLTLLTRARQVIRYCGQGCDSCHNLMADTIKGLKSNNLGYALGRVKDEIKFYEDR